MNCTLHIQRPQATPEAKNAFAPACFGVPDVRVLLDERWATRLPIGTIENSTQESGDSRREHGDSTQESTNSTQESGDSRRESGDSTQESANSTQANADSRRESGDSMQESVNSTQESGDSTQLNNVSGLQNQAIYSINQNFNVSFFKFKKV